MPNQKGLSRQNIVKYGKGLVKGLMNQLADRFDSYDTAVEKVSGLEHNVEKALYGVEMNSTDITENKNKLTNHESRITTVEGQAEKNAEGVQDNITKIEENKTKLTAYGKRLAAVEDSVKPWLEVTAVFFNDLITSGTYTLDISESVPQGATVGDYCGVRITDSSSGITLECPYAMKAEGGNQAMLGLLYVYVRTFVAALDLNSKTIDFTPYESDSATAMIDTRLGGLTLWRGTQAQYDALTSKDSSTLYFITES